MINVLFYTLKQEHGWLPSVMSGQRADGRHEEVEEGGVKAEGVRDRSNDNDMEQTGPTQVLESVRSGAGSGIGGPGQGERNHGLDPRELAPFLNALDQYHPTVRYGG
jgi:hypothetical protein